MSALYYKGEPITVDGGNRPLSGLKICALGDSNTQYMGNYLNDTVVALTGCKSVTNRGAAGASWGTTAGFDTTDGGSCIANVNRLCNPYISQGFSDEFDIITIMYGTNGDKDGLGDSASASPSETWGAMKYCFDKLLFYYRHGRIGVLLPPQRSRGIMTDSVAAIRECCEMYSIPYYDMSGQGQIARDTAMPVSFAEQGLEMKANNIYFADTVHFGETGREQFCHKYARFLERLV